MHPGPEVEERLPSLGGRRRSRPGALIALEVVCPALLGVLFVAVFLEQLHGPASPMEDGFMVLLPEKVLYGAVQNRDFDYFYGPLSLWLPAGFYAVAGATLEVERLLGGLYVLVILASLYLMGRRRSPLIGLASAVAGLVVINVGVTVTRFSAIPSMGALACVSAALVVATRRSVTPRGAAAVGALLGTSVCVRPDFVLVVVAVLIVLALVAKPIDWRWLVACVAATVLPLDGLFLAQAG